MFIRSLYIYSLLKCASAYIQTPDHQYNHYADSPYLQKKLHAITRDKKQTCAYNIHALTDPKQIEHEYIFRSIYNNNINQLKHINIPSKHLHSIKNEAGLTPLEYAFKLERSECIAYLVRYKQENMLPNNKNIDYTYHYSNLSTNTCDTDQDAKYNP
jgi:hypothetical protein